MHNLNWLRLASGILVIISCILVFKSSQRMSITVDESNHYFCGLQWWQEGNYSAWPENPAFSRVITAAGPFLAGYRTSGFDPEGDEITLMNHFFNSYRMDFFHDKSFRDPLMLARLFVLPMFLISIIFVWIWAKRLSGEFGAMIATGIYAFTPLLMGHAGLATTDITFVATFVILIWTFYRWLNKPSILNGVWFGTGLAFCMLSKFSVFPFFGIAMIVSLFLKWLLDPTFSFKPITKWLSGWLYSGLIGTGVMVLIIWAFYGFHFGAIGDEPVIKTLIENTSTDGISDFSILKNIIVPAPEWFAGIVLLMVHNSFGMKAYMLGEISTTGFWYFYPVGLTLKTPIPSLILGLFGIAGLIKGFRKGINWEVAAAFFIPFTMMISVMSSNINIGIRHIAAVYPLFAVGAVSSAIYLMEHVGLKWKVRIKYALTSLLAAQVLIVLVAYPNFTGYFNLLAGKNPGKIMADSDLDWGQGLLDLSSFTKDHDIDELYISYFGIADDCMYDLPKMTPLPRDEKVKGWIAISENNYWGVFDFSEKDLLNSADCQMLMFDVPNLEKPHTYYRWLDDYKPMAILAGSIRMYYIE